MVHNGNLQDPLFESRCIGYVGIGFNMRFQEVAKYVFSCECLISLNVLVLLRNEDLVAFGMPCFGVGFSRRLFRI